MLPAVSVSHNTVGRTRFKVDASVRHSDDYEGFLVNVERELTQLPGVDSLETNRLTGSILVRHHMAFDELESYATRRRLFSINPPNGYAKDFSRPKASAVSAGFKRPRRDKKTRRDAKEALADLTALGLFGLACVQAYRSQFLPAGLTLIFKGISFVERGSAWKEAELESEEE